MIGWMDQPLKTVQGQVCLLIREETQEVSTDALMTEWLAGKAEAAESSRFKMSSNRETSNCRPLQATPAMSHTSGKPTRQARHATSMILEAFLYSQ